MECGVERSRESGHVTYSAPNVPYTEGHDVVSSTSTNMLLGMLQPRLVISGHSHALCRYVHARYDVSFKLCISSPLQSIDVLLRVHNVRFLCFFTLESKVPEVTVPTFSWRMRPDPWFAVASIPTQSDAEISFDNILFCPLPNELFMFLVFACAGVMSGLVAVVTLWQRCRQGRKEDLRKIL
jgi:hypothetical protein